MSDLAVLLSTEELRRMRRELGWSRAEVARRLGVSREAVSNWERIGQIPLGRQRELRRVLERAVREAPSHLEGAGIRDARMRRGWSQAELARRLGVSRGLIGQWESGVLSVPHGRRAEVRSLLTPRARRQGVTEAVLELVAAEPGLTRYRLDTRLGGRTGAAIDALLLEGEVHEAPVFYEDMPGRVRSGSGLYPGPAPEEAPAAPPTVIGADLKAGRARLGWSQEKLAAALGVSRRLIGMWESGTHPVPLGRRAAIAELLANLEPSPPSSPAVSPEQARVGRAHLGWTRAELACHLGVAESTLAAWENGRRPVPPQHREPLRVALSQPPSTPPPPVPGDELREARKATGWTQAELARCLGVDQARVSTWERGATPVPASLRTSVFEALAKASPPQPPHDPAELRGELERLGLSGAELARRLGVMKGTVYRWLRGEAISKRHRGRLEHLLATVEPPPPPPPPVSAEEIRSARARLNWSQRELADRLGVWPAAVSNWERGSSVPGELRARLREVLQHGQPRPHRDRRAKLRTDVCAAIEAEPGTVGRVILEKVGGDWKNVRAAIDELLAGGKVHEEFVPIRTARGRRWNRKGLFPGPAPASDVPPAEPVTGHQLRARRTDLGWTQAELAERLNVSRSRACVWELGREPIPEARWEHIRTVLERGEPASPPPPPISAEQLHTARDKLRLTQAQLGARLGLGQTQISAWERGKPITDSRRAQLWTLFEAAGMRLPGSRESQHSSRPAIR